MKIRKKYTVLRYYFICTAIIIASIIIPFSKLLSIQLTERTLRGHSGHVNSLSWSADGEFLASGSLDGRINIWKYGSRKVAKTFKEGSGLQSISWYSNKNYIAAGFKDGTVKIWNTEYYAERPTILKIRNGVVRSVTWSPNGKYIAASGHLNKFPQKKIPAVWVWEIDSKYAKKEFILDSSRGTVNSITWSPDGKFLAGGLSDYSIRIWDIDTGALTRTISGHEQEVNSVAWNPDKLFLASGSGDGSVKIWYVNSGTITHIIAESPVIKAIDKSKGDYANVISRAISEEFGAVKTVDWSPDGNFLAIGSSDKTIRIWQKNANAIRHTLKGHKSEINSVAWDPDLNHIASGSNDGMVKIWPIYLGDIDEIIAANDKKIAKEAVLIFSSMLKDEFMPPPAHVLASKIDKSIGAKKEFETELMYQKRLKVGENEERRIKIENENLVEESRSSFKKHQAETRRKIELLLPVTRTHISFTLDIGKYDADEETFPINIKEFGISISLPVPIADAPDFKSKAEEFEAILITQMNIEGNRDYLELQVNDTKRDKIYNATTNSRGTLDYFEDRKININVESDNLSSPQITIIEPSINMGERMVFQEQTLTVKGKVTNENGVKMVRVNNREAVLSAAGGFTIEVNLKIGANIIEIEAEDTDGNKASERFIAFRDLREYPSPTAESKDEFSIGNYHALVIAIQDYSYNNVTDLDYPVQDAKNVINVLTEDYTFEQKNIHFLENPDRGEILNKFSELRSTLKEDDNLLIFYAGHGYWDEDEEQGYWLPRDADFKNRSDWLSNSVLRDKIKALKTRNTLLISDACFSGGIFKVRSAFTKPQISVQKTYEIPSRKAMTSGALLTVPDKSVFVEYLVKRLKQNKEQFLYSEKLYIDLKDAVINNSPTNQTPLFGVIGSSGDEGGDFVFVKKIK